MTSVDRDGTLEGPDLGLLRVALDATGHSVTYSGGIGSIDDVRAVADTGAAAVLVGKSLLDGRVDLREALALA